MIGLNVTFSVSHDSMATRLEQLIEWLRIEEKRIAAMLALAPAEQPQVTAQGRPVVTEIGKRIQRLQYDLEKVRDDMADAQTWLLECSTPQTWSIGMEIARWLNRPNLAQFQTRG